MSEKLSGFRMPGEWEKQKSVWIAWPYNKNDWPGLYKFFPDAVSYTHLRAHEPREDLVLRRRR